MFLLSYFINNNVDIITCYILLSPFSYDVHYTRPSLNIHLHVVTSCVTTSGDRGKAQELKMLKIKRTGSVFYYKLNLTLKPL